MIQVVSQMAEEEIQALFPQKHQYNNDILVPKYLEESS